MTKYSTPGAFKHCKNYSRSLVNDLGSIVQFAEHFDMLEPLDRCSRKPEGTILALCLSVGRHPKRGAVQPKGICCGLFHRLDPG